MLLHPRHSGFYVAHLTPVYRYIIDVLSQPTRSWPTPEDFCRITTLSPATPLSTCTTQFTMGGTVRNNWQNEADGKVGTEESQRPHQGQHEHSKQRQSPPIIPQRGQERDRTQLVHRPPENHNQHVADPLAHFLAIPWAARLLTDPATFCIVVPGRHPLASGGERLVTKVLNSAGTVRACVTFFMKLPAQWENDENQEREQDERGECRDAGSDPHPGGRDDADNGTGSSPPLSENAAFLQGGGLRDGWGPGTPFLLFNALLDLGEDLCGYKGMMHGGALAVVLDEIMCAAANNQSCESSFSLPALLHPSLPHTPLTTTT